MTFKKLQSTTLPLLYVLRLEQKTYIQSREPLEEVNFKKDDKLHFNLKKSPLVSEMECVRGHWAPSRTTFSSHIAHMLHDL